MTIENVKNKSNTFVRVMLVLLVLLLACMIGYNFFCVEPKGSITPELISLIIIVVVLVLSESFDNFSVVKLLSISREVEKKDAENQVLEARNGELLSQIISISTSQSQTQSNTNVYGDYVESAKEQKATIQENRNQADSKEVEKLLAAVGSSIVIEEQIKRIEDDLSTKNIPFDSDASRILIRHLAATQLLVAFEQIYQIIFGSQIELLQRLNQVAGQGLSTSVVFKIAAESMASNNLSWTQEQYLSYLYGRLLIVDGEEDTIHITNFGVEFITWLIRSGKSLDRAL
ncbi:hypothetical protein [Vibrio sp. K4]|uniref:hypothetical protein n=1 Tax=Vibrio sp. K4 TaxID=3391579 RepID=UPI003DA6D0FE